MQFTLAVLLGLLFGSVLLGLSRGGTTAGGTAAVDLTWPGWLALVLGVSAVAAFAAAIGVGFSVLMLPAIALPATAVVFAAGRLVSGDRGWRPWLGLSLALVPALFWLAFVIGEFVGPRH